MKKLKIKVELDASQSKLLVKINEETLFEIIPQDMSRVVIIKNTWIGDNDTIDEIISEKNFEIFVKETNQETLENIWDDLFIFYTNKDIYFHITELEEEVAAHPKSDFYYKINFGDGQLIRKEIKNLLVKEFTEKEGTVVKIHERRD